jgi:hypothetical protein
MSEENEKLKRRLVEQLKNEAEKSSTICPTKSTTENSAKCPIENSESMADGSAENSTKCPIEYPTKCSTESSTKSPTKCPTESPTEKLKIEMRYLVNEVIDEEPGSNKKKLTFYKRPSLLY